MIHCSTNYPLTPPGSEMDRVTMIYDEEVRTRALYDELCAIYAAVPGEVHLSLQGAGAHWNITITRVHRSCSIGCFQTDQHYIYFAHTSITIAVGRTAWKDG